MISIIVAIDEKNAIGRDNEMPWHLSDDLKRFKAITMGHTVIMGKNTWLSLPAKPLKGRRNIVISRTLGSEPGCETAGSIEHALSLLSPDEEAFIIGGAEIYRQTISKCDRLIVTHISEEFIDTDAFFPEIDMDKWVKTDASDIMTDPESGLDFQYVTYGRK